MTPYVTPYVSGVRCARHRVPSTAPGRLACRSCVDKGVLVQVFWVGVTAAVVAVFFFLNQCW